MRARRDALARRRAHLDQCWEAAVDYVSAGAPESAEALHAALADDEPRRAARAMLCDRGLAEAVCRLADLALAEAVLRLGEREFAEGGGR